MHSWRERRCPPLGLDILGGGNYISSKDVVVREASGERGMNESVQPEDRVTRWLTSLNRRPGLGVRKREIIGPGQNLVEENGSRLWTTAKRMISRDHEHFRGWLGVVW